MFVGKHLFNSLCFRYKFLWVCHQLTVTLDFPIIIVPKFLAKKKMCSVPFRQQIVSVIYFIDLSAKLNNGSNKRWCNNKQISVKCSVAGNDRQEARCSGRKAMASSCCRQVCAIFSSGQLTSTCPCRTATGRQLRRIICLLHYQPIDWPPLLPPPSAKQGKEWKANTH